MLFTSIIDELKASYENNSIIRENGTVLLGPGKWPESLNARHFVFKELKEEFIKEYLIDSYKLELPELYLEFLRYANGIELFDAKLHYGKVQFAVSMLTIFGLPLAPTSDRSRGEEPFDIRIEDLAKDESLPDHWLKCGLYGEYENSDYIGRNGICIDTNTQRVYGCKNEKNEIINEWNNLDECLCSIYEKIKDCPTVLYKNKIQKVE